MSRIETLERDKEFIEKDYKSLRNFFQEKEIEIEKLKKEKNNFRENFLRIEEINKNFVFEIEELKKGNNNLQSEELLKESQKVAEFKNLLDQKENEMTFFNEDRAIVEETYIQEINNLKENTEIMKEKINTLTEFKNNYDKLKDSIRDYEILKDKINDYENTQKELAKLQMKHNKTLSVNKEIEETNKNLNIQLNNKNTQNDEKIKNDSSKELETDKVQ